MSTMGRMRHVGGRTRQAALNGALCPFANSPLPDPPPRPRKESSITSHTCASSPSSSLASTPQVSPTSSSSPSQAGSNPSSIRSTSSRLSPVPKFSFKRRSSSSSSQKKPIISFSSFPPLPPLPSGGQFSTLSSSLTRRSFPPSAPIPALVSVGEGEQKELGRAGKTRKRRDSILGNWRDEREKQVLREKLDEAYERIEGDGNKGMMGRVSTQLSLLEVA